MSHKRSIKNVSNALIAAALSLTAICTILYVFSPKPELKGFKTYSRAYTDRNGRLLRITLAQDDQYRLYAPLDKISPILQEATVLYEDQDFYTHGGVDLAAICRAFWDTYIVRSRRIGASTITMQVARLRWNIKSQTVPGKLVQIVRSLQLTRHYTKPEILASYLNLASYGRNIEGIEAASLIYFNKHADALTLPEAMTLCVIPQNPSKRNPTTPKGFLELKKARSLLFKRWVEHHREDSDKDIFMDMPLAVRAPEALPFLAPHFVNDLERQLPWQKHGVIKTTLDIDRQAVMERIVSAYLEKRRPDGIQNTAAMLVNYNTLETITVVGSANFYDKSIQGQVNGTAAKRSPGSALKPFVYALAIDQGLIHPMTLLKDAPKRFAGFTPENFDQRFVGPIFARDALIKSRNVPAVKLQAQLSKPGFYDFLQKAGISRLKPEPFYGLALALGGVEVTMEELAALYAMLPNGGKLQTLKKELDDSATDAESNLKPSFNNSSASLRHSREGGNPSTNQLISPEASFLIMDILKDNPRPDRNRLSGQVHDGNEIAWKTGTSYAFRDAWAVGISGDYVLAVWVGNFPGDGNPNFIGRLAAGPLLFEIFDAINANRKWRVSDAIAPGFLNLKKVGVCSKTGDLPTRYCPNTCQSWFIPGVSPIKVSSIHRAIPIDKASGLRSCWFDPQASEMKVFEFWPSDLLHIYKLAGISLNTPPPFKSDCTLDQISASGQSPIIQSPQDTIVYALQSHRLDKEKIPFSAIVDPDVETLYWFVDNRFVGRADREKPFFWYPSSGTFNVRVVDDHSRAAEQKITVKVVR